MVTDPTPVENPHDAGAAPAAVSAPIVESPLPENAAAAVAATEAKPAEATLPQVKLAKPAEAKPAEADLKVVPDKYDLKVGESPVSPQFLDAITPLFKEVGVTQPQAQKLADAFAAHQKAVIPQIMARDLDTLRADPELGKLNFGRTQARVNDALAAFSTPQERQTLTDLGLANNLTLVRMFHRIGASMQEPPQTDAGRQPREKPATQTKLYGGRDLVQSGRSN